MRSIRPFSPADREPLELLYRQCRLTAAWLPAAWRAEFHFERDTEGERIFVAVDNDGTLEGFVSVWAPESFIHHLYVREASWRQGVGRALLAALNPQVPLPWRLKCQRANHQALQFYAALGWVKTGTGADEFGEYFVLELQALRDAGSSNVTK